jgi:NAD(P)-dependent dehydrogenase (short-subunit alcohol dehydrogenase family)
MAAKAALISSTKSMALAFSPHVRANAVLPGSLPWPQEGGLDVAATYPEAEKAAMVAAIPLGRVGGWADAVGAVRYLVDAPYITGTCIPVDGGRSAVF